MAWPSAQRLLSTQDKSQKGKPAGASGSDDNSSYKATEYYQYNQYSYFDIEKEMLQYRLPQPSSLPKIDFSWSTLPPMEKKKKTK